MLESHYNGLRFLIKEDYPSVGVYLFIYKGEKCTKDYLQDNVEKCQELALEEYKVPINSWVTIK